MLLWEKPIPDYLTNRKNIVNFILFTACFALVFINIYSPFGVDKRLDVSSVELFLYSSIVILIGMLVVVISRILMFMFTRNKRIRYGLYGLWIVGEIVAMALVYTLIQWFFLHVGEDFLLLFRNSIRTTAYIILLPYVISWLYLSFKDKYATLEKMENNLSSAIVSPSMLSFHDEKGVLKFSVKKDDLLYLEAADNYILIHYLDNEKPARYIIRSTLKRIEEIHANSGLVRSHRSFMVNIDNVKVIRKEKDGLIIGFESPVQVTVPISKSYLEVFIRKMST